MVDQCDGERDGDGLEEDGMDEHSKVFDFGSGVKGIGEWIKSEDRSRAVAVMREGELLAAGMRGLLGWMPITET